MNTNEDISQRLTTASNAGLNDPAAAYALANSSADSNDLVKVGQMYRGYQYTDQLVTDLKGMSHEHQDAVWGKLDTATQELYKSHGYEPVNFVDHSILRRVTGGLGKVVAPVGHLLGVQQNVGQVMHLGQQAADVVTHVYRTDREILTGGSGSAWDKWNKTANGEEYYSDEIRQNLKGMLPDGADDFAIATAGGMSPSQYLEQRQGVHRTDPNWTSKLVALYGATTDEKFQNAVGMLAANKISFGRDIRALASTNIPGLGGSSVTQQMIKANVPMGGPIPILKNIGAGDFISGSADAWFRWETDPTLIAGKLNKSWQVAKFGIDPKKAIEGIQAAQDAYNAGKLAELAPYSLGNKYGVAAERIAHYASINDFDGLAREMPGMMHGMESLKAFHMADPIKDANDVFDFYKTASGLGMISAGRVAGHAFPTGTGKLFLPSATMFAPYKAAVKEGIETIIDKGRFKDATEFFHRVGNELLTPGQLDERVQELDQALQTATPEVVDQLTKQRELLTTAKAAGTEAVSAPVARATWAPWRAGTEMLHNLTVHVPKEAVMDPNDPGAAEYIRQIFNYHLPMGMRKEMFNAFMTSPNLAWQKLEYETAMKLQATSAGLGNTVKGQTFLNRFFGRMNQMYAVGGLDKRLLPNGDQIRAAVWPDQIAGAWQHPSFKEWYNASRDIGAFHQTTQNVIDTIHSQVWKPSVLLRVGFIPRAFGEELVWGIAHFGTGAVARGHLMQIAAKAEGEPLAAMRPLLRMSRTLKQFAPSIIDKPVTGLDAMVEAGTNMLTRYTRRAAFNLLPGEGAPINYQGAVRHMLEHQSAAKSAFAEGFSATNTFGYAASDTDKGLIYSFQKRDADGGFQEVHMKIDGYEEVGPTDLEPHGTPVAATGWGQYRVLHHWNQYGEDSAVRNLTRSAGAQWLYPEELDSVVARAAEHGINVTKHDLYKMVPEDMPASWDLWLQGKADELPESIAPRQFKFYTEEDRGIAIQEHENLVDQQRRAVDSLMQEGDAGPASSEEIQKAENRLAATEKKLELIKKTKLVEPSADQTFSTTTLGELKPGMEVQPFGGRGVQSPISNQIRPWAEGDQSKTIKNVLDLSGEDLKNPAYRTELLGQGWTEAEIDAHIGERLVWVEFADGTLSHHLPASHEVQAAVSTPPLLDDKTINFIQSLPERQRYALFSRNSALDRHIASQELTQGRNLLDPVHLPDHIVEQTQEEFSTLLRSQEDPQTFDNYVQFLHDFYQSGHEGLPAVVDAAKAAGVPEEEIAQVVQGLHQSWMGQGYEGLLHPESGKAVIWDNNGKAIRDIAARGERRIWHDYYHHMADGNPAEGQKLVEGMQTSRMGRGDLEQELSRGDLANYMQDGTPVAVPVPQGMHRVYTITIPNSSAEAMKGFKVDPQMIDTDMGFLAMSGDQAVDFGIPGIPQQAWFTADYKQAQRLQAEMNTRFSKALETGEPGGRVSIGFRDIPTEDFNKGRALAREQLAGGMAPGANTRELSSVFVGPEYKDGIRPLPQDARAMAMYRGQHLSVDNLNSQITVLEEQNQELLRSLQKEVDDLNRRMETEPIQDVAQLQELRDIRVENIRKLEQGERVTPYSNEDRPDIQELIMDVNNPTPVPGGVGMYQTAARHPELGTEQRVYIAWDEQSNPIGALHVNIVNGEAKGLGISVDEAHQGKSIGTKLFNEAEKDGLNVEAVSGKTGYSSQGQTFAYQRRIKKINEMKDSINNADLIHGVDRGQVLEESAHTQMQDFNNTFSNPFDHEDPRDLRSVLYALERNGEVSLSDFDPLVDGHIPKTLVVPRLTAPKDANLLQKGTNKGFEWIGRAGNAIIRHPLFHHLYAEGLTTIGPLVRNMLLDPELDVRLTKYATKYGMGRDELLHAWYDLPDYIKTAGDPVHMAELHGIQLPEKLAAMTPSDAAKITTAVDHAKYVEEAVSDAVLERAQREVLPYLDDHRLRSQFQEKHRWLTPFQFAEEQFAKRWARTIRKQPELIRKAALVMTGMKHVGIITQNEFGEDIFNYPGSEYAMAGITRAMETLTGRPAMMPFANPFTGQVKYTIAGLDRFGIPAVGPAVGLPLSVLERIFPDLQDNPIVKGVEGLAYGARGQNRTIAAQLIPSSILSMYNGIVGTTDGTAQIGSAFAEAMTYMEANNLAPPDNADDKTVEIYKSRLENWARSIVLIRGALAFTTPATPTSDPPVNFAPEFKQLLRELPMQDAMSIFIARHPDGEAWTVFDTKSVSGAPLPATDQAYKVLKDNEDFFRTNSYAAPWFLPQSKESDPFSRQAYYFQLSHGYRVRKSADEIWRDIKFAESADEYFSSKETKDAGLAQAKGNKEATQAINDSWSTWKNDYFKLHPVFATELQSPDAHNRRQKTLTQMADVINDPNAPKVEHGEKLKNLVTSYQTYQGGIDNLKNDNSKAAREMRNFIKEHFNLWATTYVKDNPEVKAFWDRVIRPETGLADLTQGVN